ncbi:MAG: FAD-dependent oxidoreductase [Bacteroidales bacterium]|jgi:protoporphyrinogen oxidase|nr:FAD-dependent oxidoreductase [Bacteroidales bacterium]
MMTHLLKEEFEKNPADSRQLSTPLQSAAYVADCVVIGGGFSGIAFAHFLHRAGMKAVVLEKDDRAGGQVHTRTSGDGFWYETGAHTCYHTYALLLEIIRDVGMTGEIMQLDKFPYRIDKNGKLQKMIKGFSLFPLILRCPHVFTTSKTGKTVREYFEKITGVRNYRHFFSKAFRAVISQHADDYPAELFLKRRNTRCKEYPHKFSLAQGLSSVVTRIIEKDGFPVHVSQTVTAISGCDGAYEVRCASGEVWRAPAVAIATAPSAAAVLLQHSEPELAALLADIPISHSESLSVVVPAGCSSIERMAGIIPVNDDYLSAVSRDLIAHPQWRSFTFHFEKNAKTDMEKLQTACRALRIAPSDVKEWTVSDHVLPSLRLRHLDMSSQTEAKKRNKGIFLTGNYFKGLSLEDCAGRAREESERLIKKTFSRKNL